MKMSRLGWGLRTRVVGDQATGHADWSPIHPCLLSNIQHPKVRLRHLSTLCNVAKGT